MKAVAVALVLLLAAAAHGEPACCPPLCTAGVVTPRGSVSWMLGSPQTVHRVGFECFMIPQLAALILAKRYLRTFQLAAKCGW